MTTPAKLKDIIDALGFQMEQTFQYLNRDTGEIVTATHEELEAAETGEIADYPPWQHAQIELARQIISDPEDKFVELPSKFEINEYEIMESFCYALTDQKVSRELVYAIKGTGAFRRFKDRLHEDGLEQQWYQYRAEALGEIAKAWCEQHQITYV